MKITKKLNPEYSSILETLDYEVSRYEFLAAECLIRNNLDKARLYTKTASDERFLFNQLVKDFNKVDYHINYRTMEVTYDCSET